MPDIIKNPEAGTIPAEKHTTVEAGETLLRIAPVGRLDTVTSGELSDSLNEYDLTARDVDFDFAEVDYISSAGLRLLVYLRKNAKAGGRSMRLLNVNSVVREILRISGFEKTFTVV
ncbi:MAG: STAS domain-containing protein [Clostridia bacterium]|nr:STAS domain-containing protein [Clostridia bacterium]